MIRQLRIMNYELRVKNQEAKSGVHIGITLIEFITAIVIILILAGALLPALSKARQMAKKKNAREVIHQLEVALQTYAQDYGRYPHDDGASPTGCVNLILALDNEADGIYYCDWPTDMKDGSGNLKDPWENAYIYRDSDNASLAGKERGLQYNIWSTGPDGNDNDGEGDDIRNW